MKTLLNEHPSIDRNRVYIHGLSRGGEGALAVASDAPELFAAAASCSGREIGCVEYIDGDSTTHLALPLASMPIWLFHTKQDPIAPVSGSRRNAELLSQLGNKRVRYTEIDRKTPFDCGYVNSSAHNSWDVAYDSPSFWNWLLSQKRNSGAS